MDIHEIDDPVELRSKWREKQNLLDSLKEQNNHFARTLRLEIFLLIDRYYAIRFDSD